MNARMHKAQINGEEHPRATVRRASQLHSQHFAKVLRVRYLPRPRTWRALRHTVISDYRCSSHSHVAFAYGRIVRRDHMPHRHMDCFMHCRQPRPTRRYGRSPAKLLSLPHDNRNDPCALVNSPEDAPPPSHSSPVQCQTLSFPLSFPQPAQRMRRTPPRIRRGRPSFHSGRIWCAMRVTERPTTCRRPRRPRPAFPGAPFARRQRNCPVPARVWHARGAHRPPPRAAGGVRARSSPARTIARYRDSRTGS